MLKYISGRQYPVVPPVQLGAQEHVVTSFSIPGVAAEDRILLEMELCWEKRKGADLGRMEIVLHQGSPFGPVLYSSDETCYSTTTTLLEYEETGVSVPEPLYYVSVCSTTHTALLTGPLFIKCQVFSEE
ncbi:hypothetical protein [Paenibacillus rigui]|uniref:Uncharacterized protein n=1 Tax=Paenibacillus rigui TaxID=554312 RepID=A0A229UTQ4_9BACL|nr:hypothetical protein [Paenibacillus rigui]OXM86651.1 hypothetical protein CF651_09385 [Paenibacillus rigui]